MFLLQKSENCSQDRTDLKHRYMRPMDDLSALHLANLIANDVPMGQEHLDKALKLVLENKMDIEQTYRNNSNSVVNIFTTIANGKYGNRYREIIDEVLFGCFDDEHVLNYLEAWGEIYGETNKKPTLHDILQLLNSDDRKDRIFGEYCLMDHAFRLRRHGNDTHKKYSNRHIYGKIFTRIQELLNTDDVLAVFCAAWSIAWSGYNSRDIYPDICLQNTITRLVEIWIKETHNRRLRRQAAWAICSICKPHLEVVDTPELKNAVGENIKNPKNDHDDLAALYLGILCNYWSREETQQLLNTIRSFMPFDETRFLDDLGYKRKNELGRSVTMNQ